MAVKYKIEFESNAGVKYRVDIYDPTYSGTPIALQGGATPFTTEEDSTDDFFAPIRTSTGTLNIVDDGSIPNLMEAIVPENNVQKAVRLVRVESESESVEWQGFLSCEAYEQEFTDRTKEISINCNSCLAAFGSLFVTETDFSGIVTVLYILHKFIEKAQSFFGWSNSYMQSKNIYWPWSDRVIFNKKIDTDSMFEEKEINNENETIYQRVGCSYRDIIERICRFMGWCVREQNGTFYFVKNGIMPDPLSESHIAFEFDTMYNIFNGSFGMRHTTLPTEVVFDNYFDWNGDGHTKTISAGAGSVAVETNLREYKTSLSLPDCPETNLEYIQGYTADSILHSYINKNNSLLPTCQIDYYHETLSKHNVYSNYGEATIDQCINDCVLKKVNIQKDGEQGFKAVGAFFAKMGIGSAPELVDNFEQGVYMSGMRVAWNEYAQQQNTGDIVFKVSSRGDIILPETGYLVLEMSAKFVNRNSDMRLVFKEYDYTTDSGYQAPIIILKFGEHSYTMRGTFTGGNFTYKTQLQGYEIGPASVEIRCGTTHQDQISLAWGHFDILFTKIEVGFKYFRTVNRKESGKNSYYQKLFGYNFEDDIKISTEYASSNHNIASPFIIRNSDNSLMEKLTYDVDTVCRPEVDLLNRMAAHYGAAKRKLTLQVEHPTEPIPLMRVIDTDDRVYIPVAESRDYAADSSELTLLEV